MLNLFNACSMAYSGETNELFGGGVGCVLRWEVAAVSNTITLVEVSNIKRHVNKDVSGWVIKNC